MLRLFPFLQIVFQTLFDDLAQPSIRALITLACMQEMQTGGANTQKGPSPFINYARMQEANKDLSSQKLDHPRVTKRLIELA